MKYRVLLSVVCAVLSAYAGADPDSDYNRPAAEALKEFHKFSECEVSLHPKEAAAVVLSNDGTNLVRKHPGLFHDDCLDEGQLKILSAEYVRYGLAEALIRREFASGLPDIRQAIPLDHSKLKESDLQPKAGMSPEELAQLEKDRQRDIAASTLSVFSECVARADAADTLRLVLSDPDSVGESQAINSLQPALASCLNRGDKVELGTAMLRGSLAVNLYRLAKAPKGPLKPLFSLDDYPPEAVRQHWEGTVIAQVTVNAQGVPTSCHIAKSSGHAMLDEATCNVIMQRAKFKPSGKEESFTTPPITWAVP